MQRSTESPKPFVVRLPSWQLNYLSALANASHFVRCAVAEKMEREGFSAINEIRKEMFGVSPDLDSYPSHLESGGCGIYSQESRQGPETKREENTKRGG